MDKHAVPQDVSPTYGGQRKLLYAVDEGGAYAGVQSQGWEAETFATMAAVSELDRLRDEAWQRAKDGLTSVLEFHMFDRRMELDTLAATTGMWRWRIRRHFDVRRFARLPDRILARYSEAMGISIDQLRVLPSQPSPTYRNES